MSTVSYYNLLKAGGLGQPDIILIIARRRTHLVHLREPTAYPVTEYCTIFKNIFALLQP